MYFTQRTIIYSSRLNSDAKGGEEDGLRHAPVEFADQNLGEHVPSACLGKGLHAK